MNEVLKTDEVVVRLPPPARARPKGGWRSYAKMGVGLVIGGIIGALGAHYGLELLLPTSNKLLKLVGIALLPLHWFFVVGFHELGHLVGGWITRGRFLLWTTGPFMVRRTPVGVRFAWNRGLNVTGGLAVCIPVDPALMTPKRAAVMILGGPLASLLLAVAAIWVAALVGADPATVSSAGIVVQHAAVFVAGLSALIFVVSIAPGTAGGFKTDGRRAIDLLRGDARSDQEAALMVLNTAALAGVRPADYDPEVLRRSLALNDGSLFDRYARLTAFYHYADIGNWSAAQASLDRLVEGMEALAPHVRATVGCEYAWLLARRTRDPAVARTWLSSAGKVDFDPATRLRAEAAVLLAEGKRTEAAEKARAGIHAVEHRSMSAVKSAFALDALDEILAESAT